MPLGRRARLHVENHPLRIIKDKIAGYMMREDSYAGHGPVQFKLIDNGESAASRAQSAASQPCLSTNPTGGWHP